MKKILITVMGAALIVSVGMYAVNRAEVEASTQKVAPVHYTDNNVQDNAVVKEDLTKLPEYSTLAAQVDLSNLSLQMVEDNTNKRVIVLKDANGREQMKSIFMKTENRLKIINYRGGLVFNDIIDNKQSQNTEAATATQPTDAPTSDKEADLIEYKTLSEKVNLTGFGTKIVEDNANKRIILFNNANGTPKYKTIYIKKTGAVKVINL